ncbi:MAG: hypothetical protein U0361_22615 [Nitrospiraceae bacterium]
MNFNSVEFFVFFSSLLVLYALAFHRVLWRDMLLLVSSYFFYMCWNWKYAGLLALSTCVDYSVGRLLDRATDPRSRRWILIISLTSNLGLLALFKYYNFFMDVAKPAVAAFGWGSLVPPAPIAAASRDLLLHVPDNELYDRRIPRGTCP